LEDNLTISLNIL